VHSKEIAELDVTDLAAVETWVIVTIPEDPSALSANLQGPIILNVAARKAKQLVLANSDYSVAHRLFSKQQEGHYNAKQSSELVEV
jgi:flagellar assembly factor FliW